MGSYVQLTVLQDDDVPVDLQVLAEDGETPQSLAGLTPELLIKQHQNAPDDSATVLGVGTGLTIVSEAAGTLTAFLSREILAAAGRIWYRLVVIDVDGDRTTSVYGPLIISAA